MTGPGYVARPRDHLAPREYAVLVRRARGLSNAEVADDLGISVQTVKNHLAAVQRRLDTRSTLATLYAIGWIRIPAPPTE